MSFGFTDVFSIATVTLKINSEKKQVTIVLSYMGMISTELKVKSHKTFKQLLPTCNQRVIFKASLHMKNYFNFKDKIK